MSFAKCLLVALALWMPSASFAAAVGVSVFHEQSAPCEEAPASDELSEQNDFFPPSIAAPAAPAFTRDHEHARQHPLDGHIGELHIPPPNRAALS